MIPFLFVLSRPKTSHWLEGCPVVVSEYFCVFTLPLVYGACPAGSTQVLRVLDVAMWRGSMVLLLVVLVLMRNAQAELMAASSAAEVMARWRTTEERCLDGDELVAAVAEEWEAVGEEALLALQRHFEPEVRSEACVSPRNIKP